MLSMNLSYVLDVQSDLSYAHPQRTEAIHMHNVSKGILPQFRSQEGITPFIKHANRIIHSNVFLKFVYFISKPLYL